ncbi:MAG: transglutaminase domain-containing protein [Armatimonadetes bacterium]|nr:transglutaminase domain-containing protein [Armatimonadota bacterium]
MQWFDLTAPVPFRSRLPLFVAAYLIVLCGISAINSTLEDPAFTNLTFGLTILGFAVSLFLYRFQANTRMAEWGMLVVAAFYFGYAVATHRSVSVFMPSAAVGSSDLSLAVFLMWMAVFRSYLLISEDRLLFTCVPTIAILGLIGTNNLNNEIIVYFFVFIIASIFLLMYDNVIRAEGQGDPDRRFTHAPGLKHHLLVTMTFGLLVCIGGFLTALPIFAISSRLSPYQIPLGIHSAASANQEISPNQSLSQESYLSISEGPTRLTKTIIMLVKSSMPAYWRGRTYDIYTGRGWSDSTHYEALRDEGEGRDSWWRGEAVETTFDLPAPAFEPSHPKGTVSVEQVFRPQGGIMPVIYAASLPRRLTIAANRILVNEDVCLQIPGFQFLGSRTYRVVSDVSTASPDALRRASQEYPEDILANYLGVPANMSDVAETARQLTERATNPYDKAKTIELFLNENYVYNAGVSAAPEGEDVVSYFLYRQKEGFCQILATSMAMMARCAGIPARVVSGFAPGDYDPERKVHVVRDMHRHLWAELYFPEYGWIIFDPQPIRSVNDGTEDSSSGSNRFWNMVNRVIGRGFMPKFFVGLIFLISIYVGVAFLSDALSRRQRFGPTAPDDHAGQVIALYQKTGGRLERMGFPRPPYETSLEFRETLSDRLGEGEAARPILDSLARLTELFHHARYSGQSVTAEDAAQARELSAGLIAILKNFRPGASG